MKQQLHGAVVVITGASSGIGRVTARQFADQGARLVLAARDRQALEAVAMMCERCGAVTLPIPTDVRDATQVDTVRRLAVSRFGRIDVWVNAATTCMTGPFEQVSPEQFRGVLEANVMGVVHGCQAALAQFRAQGEGTLITVGSIAGMTPYAQASAYSASKHAIHALHGCLQKELLGTRIQACIVSPLTMDTLLFQHGTSHKGRQNRARSPAHSPERVAAAIVASARSPKREVLVGGLSARAMALLSRVAPSVLERLSKAPVVHEPVGPRWASDAGGSAERPLLALGDASGWRRRTPTRPN